MATPTYEPIASITLGSSASSVTFSSIPQTYRDLVLAWDVDLATDGQLTLILNADTSSIYSRVTMANFEGSTNSISQTNNKVFTDLSAFTAFWGHINLMDYSATDKHKSYIWRQNNTGEAVIAAAGRYASTSAITSIKIETPSGSYSTGTTFALYGIEA